MRTDAFLTNYKTDRYKRKAYLISFTVMGKIDISIRRNAVLVEIAGEEKKEGV